MGADGSCEFGFVKCRMPGAPHDDCVPAEVCAMEGTRVDGGSSSDDSCVPPGMPAAEAAMMPEKFVKCKLPDGHTECIP